MSILRVKSIADLSLRVQARVRSPGGARVAGKLAKQVPAANAGQPPRGSDSGNGAAAEVSKLENMLLFQIRASQLPEPVREFRFYEKRRWRTDFAWPDRRLLVEVEGGHWTGGRHTRGSGFDADCEKYAEASLLGWRVIRVTSTHIKSGQALDWIKRGIQ